VAGKGTILFMDDEETIQEITGAILTRMGYDVDLARDNTSFFQLRIIVNRRCP
jgi:DNA-binding response OmpR family regulator